MTKRLTNAEFLADMRRRQRQEIEGIAPDAGSDAPVLKPQEPEVAPELDTSSFAPRPSRIAGIKGFEGMERTESTMFNAALDMKELGEGYVELVKAFATEPASTFKALATELPPAIYHSYKRWFTAYNDGVLLDAVQAHPVQFIQDWAPIISLATGGTSFAAEKVFGKGIKGTAAIRAMDKITDIADKATILSDPIAGTGFVIGKKAIGRAAQMINIPAPAQRVANAALNRFARAKDAVTEPFKKLNRDIFDKIFPEGLHPQQSMNIRVDERVRSTGILEKLDELERIAEQAFIDQNYSIRRLAQRGEAARHGVPVAEAKQFVDSPLEQKVRLFSGFEEKARLMLQDGMRDPNAIHRPLTRTYPNAFTPGESKGLYQVFDDTGTANLAALRDYAVARRTFYDLEPRGIETGQDIAKAKEVLNKYDPDFSERTGPVANPDIHNRWKEWRQFQEDRLDYYTQGGMISLELADKMRAKNLNYTPFNPVNEFRMKLSPEDQRLFGVDVDEIGVRLTEGGIFEFSGTGGRKIRNPQQVVNKIKGVKKTIDDPIVADIIMSERMMREVELNQIAGEVRNLADVPGSGVRVVPPPAKFARKVSDDDLSRVLREKGEFVVEKDGGVTADVRRADLTPDLPEDLIIHYENGNRTFLQVDDPLVHQAFAGLRMNTQNDVGRFFETKAIQGARAFASLKRAGITLDPGFSLGTNVARDTIHAGIASKFGFVPVYHNIRGAMDYLKKGEMFDLWAASGGMQAELSSVDRRVLRDRMRPYMGNRDYLKKISNAFFTPIELLRDLQRFSEATTRLGEFGLGMRKQLRQLGFPIDNNMSTLDAVLAAERAGVDVQGMIRKSAVSSRDVATDFGIRPGSPVMRGYNSMTAFQNAHMQSLDLMRRRLLEGTVQDQVRYGTRAGLFITLPSLMLYGANKGNPEYQDIPRFEKDLFWHIPLPDALKTESVSMARTPRPFELGLVFGTVPERVIEALSLGDPAILDSISERTLQDFQPFAFPDVLSTALELYTDHDFFFDAPLTPLPQKRLRKVDQSLPSTSKLAKHLSRWTEYMSEPEGKYKKPGDAFLSPIQIDKIIYGTTGTIGRNIVESGDRVHTWVKGDDEIVTPAPRSGVIGAVPVANRFVANLSGRSQIRTDFYDLSRSLEQLLNSAGDPRQTADTKQELLRYFDDIKDAVAFRQISREVAKLTKIQREIELSREIKDRHEKRRKMNAIDRNINNLCRRALELRKKSLDRR